MPLLGFFDVEPMTDEWRTAQMADGRQSPAASKVRRGVGRLLREMGYAVVPEVILANGRRADLVALGTGGEVWIVEIKSCLADYRADAKWPDYRAFCDRFFFATLPEVGDIFPASEGLIVTDGYDAEIAREAPVARIGATARRTMTLRIAQTAARRLHEMEDPSPFVAVAV